MKGMNAVLWRRKRFWFVGYVRDESRWRKRFLITDVTQGVNLVDKDDQTITHHVNVQAARFHAALKTPEFTDKTSDERRDEAA